VGFEAVGGEAGYEFQYSDIIAERLDTSHHKIFVDTTQSLTSRAASRP
jgi:asparagine synthase (glutamine-hydrolysing)